MSVKCTLDKVAEVMKEIHVFSQQQTFVGVPQDKTGRKEGGNIGAAIAYVHETGSPSRNIPARPFLHPGIVKVQGKITDELKDCLDKALNGNTQALDKSLHRIGLIAQASVRATITAGEGFAPLSKRTLAARRARGRTGEKPLIDTGQLRNSINYVIRKVD